MVVNHCHSPWRSDAAKLATRARTSAMATPPVLCATGASRSPGAAEALRKGIGCHEHDELKVDYIMIHSGYIMASNG